VTSKSPSDPELISAAITASGLSARRFAERVLARDERTVRRWVNGDGVIPPLARDWLTRWIALPERTRGRIVSTLETG
jgi:hypothetical protein